MENIEKRGERISGHVSDLRFVHEGLVEEIGRILLFKLLLRTLFLFLVLFLLDDRSGNIKSHLYQLIWTGTSLATLILRAPIRPTGGAIRLRVGWESKLDGHLILSGQVGVGDFGIRDLEGGPILDIECELCLGEFGPAPVPPPQTVFPALDADAIPNPERLTHSIEILQGGAVDRLDTQSSNGGTGPGQTDLLLEAIQLDDP
jgi:hypothetical protein